MKNTQFAALPLIMAVAAGCALHTRAEPVAVGSPAPHFDLADAEGNRWQLPAMLESGPAVVIFYRGYW